MSGRNRVLRKEYDTTSQTTAVDILEISVTKRVQMREGAKDNYG